MIDTLIPCDNCGNVFNKPTNKITKVNFCCRDCMDRYNSERFSNYNETDNPMNAKGRTIEERFAMRDRRMNAKDRVGKDVHTDSKQLGEPEHRKIMRIKLGRELRDDEVIHHIDGNRYNNKPNNLAVMTRSEHTRLHMLEYWRKKHANQ